jgi:hypothetical protein
MRPFAPVLVLLALPPAVATFPTGTVPPARPVHPLER